MGGEWKQFRLDEISELIVDCPHSTPKWTDQGVVVLRNQYIRNGRLDLSSPSYTTEEDFKNRVKRAVPSAYDLVFTREAPMGEVCQIPEGLRCCLGQRMVLIRADQKCIDSTFLLFALQSPFLQHQVSWNAGTGTTVSNIRIPNLKAFSIPTPSLREQKAIAHILGSLDDKIELNRKLNATLEAMAQALFRSWFVDFDPVIDNALAAGNPIPESLQARAEIRKALGDKRKPLPEDIQQHFPSSFVFSEEMGWIPEGWIATTLGEITSELRRGISPKYVDDGGVRVINQKCIRNHGINGSLARRNDETKKKINGRELTIGDVLVNSTGVGTLGRMAQVLDLNEVTVVDSHVTVIRSNHGMYKSFTFARMMLELEPRVEAMGEGSTGQTELSRANLQAIFVLVPPLKCQDGIEKILFDSAKNIAVNLTVNEILTQLRDTLLPKLLSGQLRVKDAEDICKRIL